jgi:hypothetical protein
MDDRRQTTEDGGWRNIQYPISNIYPREKTEDEGRGRGKAKSA